MEKHWTFTPTELTLLLTAFAAGTVDVISFATLGGVFASAMTGNLALLAYYLALGDVHAVMASVVALGGFIVGCGVGFIQRRGRAYHRAVELVIGTETALLLLFALYGMWMAHAAYAPSRYLQIGLLAVAMGLQGAAGQMISLTTIVFTSTLTRLVGVIVDSIAGRERSALQEARIQSGVVLSYLLGVLLAGILIVQKLDAVLLLPFAGVALAFVVLRRSHGKSP